MKKIIFASMMLLGTMSVNAQYFSVFRSVDVPRESNAPSTGYGVPFSVFEPVYTDSYRQRQQPKPKMQEVTLRGYYKKGNDWYHMPIRVGVIGEEVRLLSIKTQHGWSNCGSTASEVGVWDSEEIRDNFNYKVYSTLCGTIYF